MKELNISYHLDGYSALVNNCMDYNIAGAAGKGREGGSKGVSSTTAANFSSASS